MSAAALTDADIRTECVIKQQFLHSHLYADEIRVGVNDNKSKGLTISILEAFKETQAQFLLLSV